MCLPTIYIQATENTPETPGTPAPPNSAPGHGSTDSGPGATISHRILQPVFARNHIGCCFAAELHIAPAALFKATYEKTLLYSMHPWAGGRVFEGPHPENPLSPSSDRQDRLHTSYLVHIPSCHAVLAMAPAIHGRTQGGPLHRPSIIPWPRVHPTHLWDRTRAEPSAPICPDLSCLKPACADATREACPGTAGTRQVEGLACLKAPSSR